MIARRTEVMEHSANLARLIDLHNKGFEYIQPFEEFQTLITTLRNDLENIDEVIKEDSENWSAEENLELYYENSVPIWEATQQEYSMKKKNMFDVLSDFKRHLKDVDENLNKNLTMQHPSIYFLFRNGYGESSKYSKISQDFYEAEWEIYIQTLNYYVILTYLLTGVVMVVGCLLIGWKLYQLQNCSNKIWNIIFNFPHPKVREKYSNTLQRLEFLPFDEEPLTGEDVMNEEKNTKKKEPRYYKPW
eukprot:CAMPEP_0202437088 /NCGR_PEP_ID=MMETSP1345-20130828/27712_1 /ASSEMBLY_ACC=CAM_ASM_000843 /TAXON_ID=342563 /ORGANISM="Fabrea Fabrea salina" /LENGTH=245 /DNA_ID=CAMNT_0049050713 /DNA_START=50 /DNA_END=784 /DNA_ORIENTATION=+